MFHHSSACNTSEQEFELYIGEKRPKFKKGEIKHMMDQGILSD